MPLLGEYKPFSDTAQFGFTEPPEPKVPGWGEMFGAAFRQENDVFALSSIMNERRYPKQLDYNPLEMTKNSEFWDDDQARRALTQAGSTDEWNYIANKIRQERKDQETLAASGLPGYAAAIAAGLISPTMLIPVAAPYKGLKGVLAATALGGAAAAMQEIPLQIDQLTRTPEESALAIGIGAITGGVLGGGAQYLTRREMQKIEQGVARSHGDIASPQAPLTKVEVAEARRTAAEIAAPGERVSKTIAKIEEDGIVTGKQVEQLARDAKLVQPFIEDRFGPYVDVAPVATKSRQIARWTLEPAEGGDATLIRLPAKEIIHITEDGDFITANGTNSIFHVGKDGNLTNPEAVLKALRAESASPVAKAEDKAAEAATAKSLAVDNSNLASAGAAENPTLPKAQGLAAKSKFEQWMLDKLAKPHPTAATIVQQEFPTFSRMMAAISTGGLKLSGASKKLVANIGGTIEARKGLYDRYVADTVLALDQHYTDYFYNGAVQGKLAESAASFRSTFRFTGEKMTRKEFNIEVSRAIHEGSHKVPQVKAAADIIQNNVFAPIEEQMRSVGLISGEVDLGEDPNWLKRIYDKAKIDADPSGFVDTLASYYKEVLQDRFAKEADRLAAQEKWLQDYVDDTLASWAEVDVRRKAFQKELEGLEETDTEVAIKALEQERRQLKRATPEGTGLEYMKNKEDARIRADELQAEIKRLREQTDGTAMTTEDRMKRRSELKRRLRQLDRSYWAMEERQAQVLRRVDDVEQTALDTLGGLVRKGKKLQRDLDKISEKELRRQLNVLVKRHNQFQLAWLKRQERIEKLMAAGDQEKVLQYIERIGSTHLAGIKKVDDIMSKFDDVENLLDNREVLSQWLEDIVQGSAETINRMNLKRGQRIERLLKKAEKLDPKAVLAKVDEAKMRQALRRTKANDRMRVLGIDDFNWQTGEAMVDEAARKVAEATKSKIQGLNNQIAGLDFLGEERGSEVARTLKISSMHPTPDGSTLFDKYLENDIERIVRNYVREISADIELKRTFGDVNGKEMFAAAEEEYNAIARKMKEDGASEKEIADMTKRYRRFERNTMATIQRLRHQWGIPDDPDGFAARGAKVMLDLNTLRYMGSVAISSIPDLARPVMKYGVMRAFNSGYLNLIRDFKRLKLATREVYLAGGALDPILHSRAMALTDIMHEPGQTLPERALHTVSSKIGLVAGFDYWTKGMKQMSGVMQIAEMMDSIALISGKEAGSAKELAKASEYLHSLGIDDKMAMRIMGEVEAGGGAKVNGIWLPNTEDWSDASLVRSFRAAIRSEVDNTIVTPGVELPLFTNSSLGTRLLFQFKSFALSSNSKVLMAGLQERDMRMLEGVLMSVALGMLSYYISARTIGGKAEEKMMNAGLAHWFDEGWARAGVGGAFNEVQRLAERVPALQPYANFSGERTTRRAGSSLVEAALGPSFDLATTAANVLSGIDDPTKGTVKQFFDLLPFQNVFYLRRLFDMVAESASENLPERRTGNGR